MGNDSSLKYAAGFNLQVGDGIHEWLFASSRRHHLGIPAQVVISKLAIALVDIHRFINI